MGFRLLCAAVLVLVPLSAHAQKRPCITDEEIERVLGPQVRSGAMLVDASGIDNGRPLCTGGTIAQRIHRMREELHPEERAARLDGEERTRADIARIAAQEEADRIAARELDLLERDARAAEARRDAAMADRAAAEARAGISAADLRAARNRAATSEAELRDARARSKLAALPRVTLPPNDAGLVAANLDALLQSDASFWMYTDGYRPGSVRDIRMSAFDPAQRSYRVSAEFTYRNGSAGGIDVMYLHGEIDCVRIRSEFMCRKPGSPESVQIALGLFDVLKTVGAWLPG